MKTRIPSIVWCKFGKIEQVSKNLPRLFFKTVMWPNIWSLPVSWLSHMLSYNMLLVKDFRSSNMSNYLRLTFTIIWTYIWQVHSGYECSGFVHEVLDIYPSPWHDRTVCYCSGHDIYHSMVYRAHRSPFGGLLFRPGEWFRYNMIFNWSLHLVGRTIAYIIHYMNIIYI